MWRSTISFVNANVVTPTGVKHSIRFAGHVLSVGEAPGRHDVVMDLDGAFVLPGLINAHEHLELNHYGRLKFRERYTNVSGWVDDMRPRLSEDPAIRAGQSHRLAHRLFIGGLKNMLAGVTTVAHHNPVYREIGRFCAVRVVKRFGWAHSYEMESQPAGARGEPGGDMVARHRATDPNEPFIVHLAEGTDAAARAEFDRFDADGCLTPNAVLVHGVALTPAQQRRMIDAGSGLVWCPASNLFLFGETPDVRPLLADAATRGRVALASDSRLSGARDLLDEVRVAHDAMSMPAKDLLHLVTTGPAELLRLPNAGHIATGKPADFTVLPHHAPDAAGALLRATRKDVRLVMVGGRPLVADADFSRVFRERRVPTRMVTVDDATKVMDASVARLLERSPIGEDGVEVEPLAPARVYAVVTSR